MKRSVGIIPYRKRNGVLEFFVGHPGGPYFENHDWWAYLKGEKEDGEDDKEVAVREFQEETGIRLTKEEVSKLIYIGETKQNAHKIAVAYAIEKGDIDPEKCYSNLVDNEDFPEVDKYCWMTFNELKDRTIEKHIWFYEKIQQLVTE